MKTWICKVLFVPAVFFFSVSMAQADSFTNKIKSYGEELFGCQSDNQCVWAQKECCGGVMVISSDYEKRWNSFWQAQCRGFECSEDTIIPGGVFARCVDNQCQIVRNPVMTPNAEPVDLPEEQPSPIEEEKVKAEEPEAEVVTPQKTGRKPKFDLNTQCSELTRRSDKEKCYVQKMDNGLISTEVCEGLKDLSSRQTEECYMTMAHETGDLFFCNAIENPDSRFACYHQETKGRVK